MRYLTPIAALFIGCTSTVVPAAGVEPIAEEEWKALMGSELVLQYAAAHEPDGTRRANVRVGDGTASFHATGTSTAEVSLELAGLLDYPRRLSATLYEDHLELESSLGTLLSSVSADPCGDTWTETSRVHFEEGTGTLDQLAITFTVDRDIHLIEGTGCSGIHDQTTSETVVLTLNLAR